MNKIDPGAGTIAKTTGGGVINFAKAGDGDVFLAAFELGGRPLTDWAGIGTLWQRLLLKRAPDAYTSLFDYNLGGGDVDYYSTQILNEMPVQNASASRALVVWLLGGFVGVSGILMYLLLKRLDRRELLWLTMPACALITAFLVFRIGVAGDSSQPISTSYAWAMIDAGGQTVIKTSVGAATPSRESMRLSAGSDVTLEPTEQSDFDDRYYEDGTFIKTPSKLRYVRTLGAENSVELPAQPAWTLNALTATDGRSFEGNLNATIWMEDDGLHGRVKNGSPYPLAHCAVISSAGYSDMGDLAPGQEKDFALLKLTDQEADQIKAAQQSDDGYSFVPEGRITGSSPNGQSGLLQVDAIASAAICKEYRIPDKAERDAAYFAMSDSDCAERSVRQSLIRMCMDKWAYGSFDSNPMFFRFYGFSDQIGVISLTMNGANVTRKAHLAVVDKEIAYQPVGPTGVAFYPMGLIMAHVVDTEGGAPAMLDEAQDDKSFRVKANPAFGFTIPDADKLTDLEVTLQSRFYDDAPSMALFNEQTGSWDESKTTFTTLKGDALKPYLSKDGNLYVRYSPGPKSDTYQEIMPPRISVSGRYRK